MTGARTRFDPRQAGRHVLAAYLVLAVLNVVFAVLTLRPRVASFAALTADSGSGLTRLTQREEQVGALERYAAALRKAEGDLEHFRREVLSTRDRRMIQAQLEVAQLAERFNVGVERIQYENQPLEEEGLDRFAQTVPLQGGYTSLRRFIQAVEESEKFLVIERVALVQGSDGGSLLELNITLATYFDSPELRPESPRRRRRAEART